MGTAKKAVFFILFFAFSSVAFAGDEDVVARSLKGQEMIFERNYDAAAKIFDALAGDYPLSPAGHFGLMAVLEMRMLEREDFHLEAEFRTASKAGIKRARAILGSHDPKAWDLFLAGSIYGLDGFFKARKGEWWDAYTEGSKSRQIFRHVKEMDPAFVDADFGLGMYIYWRSAFARDLWFLKMFPDRRDEGIRVVERIAKEGKFSKELARVNLGIMYFEDGRYPSAAQVFEEYAGRYPNNVLVRMFLGRVKLVQKKYDEGIARFREILKIDPALLKPHYFIGVALILKGDKKDYDEAENELKVFISKEKGKYWPGFAHYWLGRLAEAKGNKELARHEYREALKLRPGIKEAASRARSLGGGV